MERFSWTLAVDCVRPQPNDRLGASISAQQKGGIRMTRCERERCLESHSKMRDTANIRFVNKTMAQIIMKSRTPKGLFVQREGEKFVGIDNRTGAIRREEFATKFGCLDWLTGSMPAETIRRRERQRKEAYC